MSADEERDVKQRMTAYARQSLAKDARVLDLRFEAGAANWVASAVSKTAGIVEIVAVQENGQWRLSSSKSTKHHSRAMTGTRIEREGPVKMLVKLAVLALFLVGGYLALPYAQNALKQLPSAAIKPPSSDVPRQAGTGLDSALMNSATELANDPARKAAVEKATAKLIGDQGVTRGLDEVNRLNAEALGQRP
ncbi:hypothetical protein J7643_10920 [bacterium]|nr:hypothetical protein [bacterium]